MQTRNASTPATGRRLVPCAVVRTQSSGRKAWTLAIPLPNVTSDRKPPTQFQIWPVGKILTTKGTFLFDKLAAKSVMSSWRDYGNRITFDFEHMAVNPERRAGDGKAAGSCQLELRADGLWAVDVRWTPTAAKGLADGEWLYFSPFFESDEKTGRILELINIALTNVPATKNMQPLVAASRSRGTASKGTDMANKTKAAKTKTDDDVVADDTQAADPMAKFKSAKQKAQDSFAAAKAKMDAAKAVCDALDELDELDDVDADGLDDGDPAGGDGDAGGTDDAGGDDATTTDDATDDAGDDGATATDDTTSGKPVDPNIGKPKVRDDSSTKPAPAPAKKPGRNSASRLVQVAREITGKTDESEIIGALRGLAQNRAESASNRASIVALENQLKQERVEKMIVRASREGKLTPKMRPMALAMGMRDPKELQAFIETMPVVAPTRENAKKPDGTRTDVTADPSKVQLSKIELKIAKDMGLDPEVVRKQKADNVARLAALRAAGGEEDDE